MSFSESFRQRLDKISGMFWLKITGNKINNEADKKSSKNGPSSALNIVNRQQTLFRQQFQSFYFPVFFYCSEALFCLCIIERYQKGLRVFNKILPLRENLASFRLSDSYLRMFNEKSAEKLHEIRFYASVIIFIVILFLWGDIRHLCLGAPLLSPSRLRLMHLFTITSSWLATLELGFAKLSEMMNLFDLRGFYRIIHLIHPSRRKFSRAWCTWTLQFQ